MVEDKDVMIATTGDDRKLSSLIRIGLQDFLVWKKHSGEVVMFWDARSGSVVRVRGRGNVTVIGCVIR